MNGVSVKGEDAMVMMMIMTMIGMMMMAVVAAIIRTKDVVGMIRIVDGLAVDVVVIADLKKKIRLTRRMSLLL